MSVAETILAKLVAGARLEPASDFFSSRAPVCELAGVGQGSRRSELNTDFPESGRPRKLMSETSEWQESDSCLEVAWIKLRWRTRFASGSVAGGGFRLHIAHLDAKGLRSDRDAKV